MASHIKVDLPIMQETVGKYDQAKAALTDSITAMKSAVDSVSWTGAAAQALRKYPEKRLRLYKCGAHVRALPLCGVYCPEAAIRL